MLSAFSAVSGLVTPGAVPRSTVQRCTTVRCITLEDVKADSGVTPLPVPGGYFDPFGLMANQGQIDASYRHYKEVEIKHGRIAMLAAVGFLVGEQFHPLFGGGIDAPSYLAFQQTPLQTFWPAVVAGIGAIETITSIPAFEKPQQGEARTNWKIRDDHISGDAGFFGGKKLAMTNPAKFKEMQTKEINNGRLAMFGIVGMVGQELASGKTLF